MEAGAILNNGEIEIETVYQLSKNSKEKNYIKELVNLTYQKS
jgi:hypothetical protein